MLRQESRPSGRSRERVSTDEQCCGLMASGANESSALAAQSESAQRIAILTQSSAAGPNLYEVRDEARGGASVLTGRSLPHMVRMCHRAADAAQVPGQGCFLNDGIGVMDSRGVSGCTASHSKALADAAMSV
jgi:hypothetical protein